VYVTVDVQDVSEPEISITTTGETSEVSFKAVGGTDKATYALKFATFKAVDEETSKWAVGPRHVVFVLMKKEEGYWERLLAKGVKMNNLKVGTIYGGLAAYDAPPQPFPAIYIAYNRPWHTAGFTTQSALGADLIVQETRAGRRLGRTGHA
jgi:hypothetical protein